ncbi:hypothetical protein [Janthinobacterium sp. CG3]|uniref:hypothetical protein n=1 Tax=Janthinobacterium sp. CG3 TaxID=1075768 RepID=UPI0006877D76|nr:hypothetical protein [Janthinobacterium sp. CG3]
MHKDESADRGSPAHQPRYAYDGAIRDTIVRFEATGSPVITNGEQRKYHNFWTYCVHGLANMDAAGFQIPFLAGHVRRMPRLTAGPFRYMRYSGSYLDVAMAYATVPVKRAIISPSALSLMYPAEGIAGYPREQFIADLLLEHETEIRRSLAREPYKVQIDFTEGRWRSRSTHPASCSTVLSTSTTWPCRAFRRRSARASMPTDPAAIVSLSEGDCSNVRSRLHRLKCALHVLA